MKLLTIASALALLASPSLAGDARSHGNTSAVPDVYQPNFGGGGGDCPSLPFGAARDCNKRKVVILLSQLYGVNVGRAYAEKNIDGVKEAVASATIPPAAAQSSITPGHGPDVCVGSVRWTAGERKRHPECQG